MSELQNLLKRLKETEESDRRKRKSDDIVNFIIRNWKLFAASRRDMDDAVSKLGKDGIGEGVDALCFLLGLPESIRFKRITLENFRRGLASMVKSGLVADFQRLSPDGKPLTLFEVVGEHALVVTNLNVAFPENAEVRYYKGTNGQPDIHVFDYREAAVKIPNMKG